MILSRTICNMLLACLVLLALEVPAQNNGLAEALAAYQSQDSEKARTIIDEVFKTPDAVTDPVAWQTRGFIYKQYYKKIESSAPNSEARPIAVEAFAKALALNPSPQVADNVKKAMVYLGVSYYNDAVSNMSAATAKESEQLYGQYRSTILTAHPEQSFTQQDISFKLALGGIYSQSYSRYTKKDKTQLQKAIALFEEVLELDAANITAHYNLGVLYFNEVLKDVTSKEGVKDAIESIQLRKLERESDHPDANCNLGINSMNKAVEIINTVSSESSYSEYIKVRDEADALYKKAMEHFKECSEIKGIFQNQ